MAVSASRLAAWLSAGFFCIGSFTGVDAGSVTAQTDLAGCVSFIVSSFPITEGNVMKFGLAIPHDRVERLFRMNDRRGTRRAETI